MIYIIQCLCPNRHAIFGIAYDPDFTPHDLIRADFQKQIEKWIADKTINPWCGICGSRIWTYEQGRTKFTTLAEARPELQALEIENLISRAVIDERKAEKN